MGLLALVLTGAAIIQVYRAQNFSPIIEEWEVKAVVNATLKG